jgi:hypothetical protein
MPQSHVVKRGSQFYFRIAVPLSLTKLVGKREIKASLRTSDAMSARMRGRVLSNGLELLFGELRSMANVSNDVILTRAKDYQVHMPRRIPPVTFTNSVWRASKALVTRSAPVSFVGSSTA